ncbi:Cytosolic copper metallochaperone [Coemansia sp. BCRC 34301]|nr:Cytosolic copper metallochaperone [Coemansia sp. BCRC 34301]
MTGAAPVVPQVAEAKQDGAKKAPKHQYTFRVKMACGGCSGAITKALKAYNPGSITVDQATPVENIVKVTTALPREEVLQVIIKTGKEVFDEPPAKEQAEAASKPDTVLEGVSK